MNSDPEKLFLYWDMSHRWTCCGMSAGQGINGCDHHGDLSNDPCTCDFCKSGQPLPLQVYEKKTQHNKGLTLRRCVICDLEGAIALDGWGLIGHRVVHYNALVMLYHHPILSTISY